MKTISYFIFGDKKEYQLELSLSVLSAVRFLRAKPSDIRIVLITEAGKTRPDLPIECVHFSPEEFSSWSGPGGNLHRAKGFALRKVIDTFGGSVAFLDPDTYFLKHPDVLFERISETDCLMHAREGTLGTQDIWRPIISRNTSYEGYCVSADSAMYNSGVIGIHHKNRQWLAEAKALEDALYQVAPVFNAEQFATGAVLQKRAATLHECKDVLKHYWGPERRFIQAQCADLFPVFTKENFESLAAADKLPKLGYPPISVMSRLSARVLLGARASHPNYRFGYIAARESVRLGRVCSKTGNVWGTLALDAVNSALRDSRSTFKREAAHWRRDFRQLKSDVLDTLDWMDPALRRGWAEFWLAVDDRPDEPVKKSWVGVRARRAP